MPTKVQPDPSPSARIASALERISRQLDTGLKLALKELQRERKTIDMVRMLGGLGCRASDIADWLNTPVTTVAPILSRMNADAKKKGKKDKK